MRELNNTVIGLFFEVTPKPGHLLHYFQYVEQLKPELEKQKGLLWLERYQTLLDNEILLSHQLWDHQDSIVAWRKNKAHRSAQIAGIKTHFQDYRIRIGERLGKGSINRLAILPIERTLDQKLLLSIHGQGCPVSSVFDDCGLKAFSFSSVIDSKSIITLCSLDDISQVTSLAKSINTDIIDKAELFLINRDYSMFDRNQAPSHNRSN